MNNKKINTINKYLLVIFFILQPVLELALSLFSDKTFSIAGISIATLIRYSLIAFITILAIIANIKRKSTKFFIGILISYAVYIILHYYNIKNFDITILGTSMKKSFITASIYISKFIIPICLVYLVYILNFDYKSLKIVVLTVVAFVSLLIIITNLLGVDYVSYSFENNPHPVANIIKWFDANYKYDNWRDLTSRGLYPSGNELSSFFVLLFPLTIWISLKEKKNFYFLFVLFQMISMLLVGTRIAVYGEIVLLISTVFIWVLEKLLKKEKLEKSKIFSLLIVLAVFSLFFFNSPFLNRIKIGDGVINSYTKYDSPDVSTSENLDSSSLSNIEYIEKNYSAEGIPDELLYNTYNYLEHSDFWVHIIRDLDFSQRNNSRKLKTLILQDIENSKPGKLDELVGIGEIPIYPERDYVAQYYYIGILGILLFLLPLIILFIIFGLYNFIRLLAKKIDGFQLVLLLSFFFITATAYLSGHTLEPIYITSFIGLISGMMLSLLLKGNYSTTDNHLRKYIKKVYNKGKANFINELQEHIKNNQKSLIVTANPETLITAIKNVQLDACLMDSNTIIVPDGIGVLLGAKLLSYSINGLIPGVELCKDIFNIFNNLGKSIYLFGSSQEVIDSLQSSLSKQYPNMIIVGANNGYVENKQEVFENIKNLKPDGVLVALGVPEQELLIYNNFSKFDKGIFMGVGGSFDVLSGHKKRAPKFFRRIHCEWLYRIVKEPKRFKRFLKSNVKYVFKIIQER